VRTGVALLPLHSGKAPAWLFQRMKRLSAEITSILIDAGGAAAMLRRLSDPFWFRLLDVPLGLTGIQAGSQQRSAQL